MFRKTAFAMAMLGAFASTNVAALGLGEIELKSALNQPLNAEVELLSATSSELDELKIAVASPQAFASAGIDRPLFLNKLRFHVTRNPQGTPVILITSREVVREPFLDFLLEISWSKGRMVREYTVLVDPPVTMPAPAPVTRAPVQAAAPSAPARRVTHTAQMPPVSVKPGEYGPTQRNDTLWSIAEAVRPDSGVSVEQTMLGLLRANPEAFIGNNINNLKAGYVLRVPTRDELTSISRAQARRETRAQYAAWRSASHVATSVGATAQGVAPATATAATATAATAPAAAPTEPSLQLVAPEASDVPAEAQGAKGLESVQQELLMANEALEEQRRKSEEMSSRLSMLEEQIANMQRLIQLKDNELARLQAQAGGAAAVAVEPPTDAAADAAAATASEHPPVAPVAAAPLESPAVATAPAESAGTPSANNTASAANEAAPGAEAEPSLGEDAPLAAPQSPPAEATAASPEPSATDAEAPSAAAPVAAPQAGFVDRLLANPLWLGAGALVVLLLGFLGLRRKRGVETEFQESILQASQADTATDSEIVASEPISEDSKPAHSSLLSEFAVSDMGSIRNDGEADPLAEADVYLAYGRYQQAEDLIKDALEKDPEREDLNLKLLEVYMAGHNTAAFDDHAQQMLVRLGGGDNATWGKIAEMGRELSPDNPIYHQDSPPATAASEPMADADPDLDVPEIADEAEDNGLDFDLDLGEFAADSADGAPADEDVFPEASMDADAADPQVPEDNAPLEFDLDDFSAEMAAGAADDEPQGDGELTDLDEVSTKLDLARAYIDMGDPDGARSILDEVMEEGSEEQKEEARGIKALITS